MFKKKAAFLAVVLSLASAFTACSGSNSSSSTSSGASASTNFSSSSIASATDAVQVTENSNLNPAGEFPIVKEKVTLNVFATPRVSVEDMATNEATKWLEEKTNVHIEWQIASPQDGKEKMSLMMASQSDLPDVFLSRELTAEQAAAYGGEGMLLNLSNLVEEYGVNMKRVNEYDSNYFKSLRAADGSIYGIGEFSECYHCSASQKMWMNQKWMDSLGLATPTTTEEFYNVLKAFKEQDANGNGNPDDEIPMACTVDGNYNQVESFLMFPFIYNTTYKSTWLYLDENKKVAFSANQEGYREGLRYIKRLYSEGLIDKECFINKQEQLKVLLSDPNGNRVGSFPHQSVDRGVEVSRTEYAAIAPLKGPDGKARSNVGVTTTKPMLMITKDCEYPDVAFRWGDAMMFDIVGDLEAGNYEWVNFRFGPEDQFWSKAAEGETAINGGKAYFKWNLPWGENQNYHWNDLQPHFSQKNSKGYMSTDLNVFDQERVLWEATEKLYDPVKEQTIESSVPSLSYLKEESAEISTIKAAIVDFVRESISKFVTGVSDLEGADWDNYVKELDNIGLPRLIELTQTVYDRQFGSNS